MKTVSGRLPPNVSAANAPPGNFLIRQRGAASPCRRGRTLAMLVLSFCLGSQTMAEGVGLPPFKAIDSYPFRASAERAAAIRRGQALVDVEGAPSSVVAALGEPDEVMPLYEPKHNATKVIGYTYWYVIQRRVRSGSVLERQESALRIAFSLYHKVSAIDSWTDGARAPAR